MKINLSILNGGGIEKLACIPPTSRSYSRTGSHISYEEETRNLGLEVDHLCRKLHRK